MRGLGWLVVALLALGLGCVSREHRDVREAREAYRACVASRSAEDPECRALAQKQRAAEERYERNARRAWSCDPAREECPTPR